MQSQTDNETEPKKCESCGESFGCGARLDGCWCVNVEISAEIADDLKQKFNNCLCPKCLASLAETKPTK